LQLSSIYSHLCRRADIAMAGRQIPNFQPQQIAATNKEVKSKGFNREEHTMPYLDWFDAPKKKNGACMLFITGGGYNACVDGLWIDRWQKDSPILGMFA